MELSKEQKQTRYAPVLFRSFVRLRRSSSMAPCWSPVQKANANWQLSFLAIVLPTLTLSTHLLLSLSFALPSEDQAHPCWSLLYNGLAALASVLGLVGAIRVSRTRLPLRKQYKHCPAFVRRLSGRLVS